MTRTTPFLLAACASLTLLGCSGGGGGSSSASSAAPATSNTSTAPTQSSTPAPTATAAPPASTTGSGGSGGVPGDFTRTYQQRDYRLIVPSSYATTQPMPLLLAFHGSGDTADNFANTLDAGGWFAAAEQAGVILVVPDTKSPFQSFPVWSGNPNNDIPEMQAELAEVVELLRQDVFTRYDVDTAHTHVLGFSDGGLFTAAVALAEPLFATHSIWGYGWGAAYVTPPSRAGPVSMVCGTSDRFFAGANASQAFLDQQGHEVDWQPIQGVGHTFLGLSQVSRPADALAWMLARPLPGGSVATPPAAPPTTPPAVTGSGGTGGQPGLNQLQATSQAAAGLPSITVGYDVYAPANYDPQVAYPVVFAANMGLTPWRALADQEGIVVVDFRDHDRNGGYNFNYDVLLMNALIGQVESTFNIDRKRRYYHGFSAGAHWGYVVVLANANSFAALGINAGSMGIAIQQGVWPGQVQRKIPVAIRHGNTDQVVPVAAGQQDRARLMNAGHTVAYEEFGGGHVIRAADAAAVWTFMQNHRAP
ncbi:MAG TPA: hypothetical protein DEA08_33295 [Planctomycetes bacterium]|nr:hypothetical protein [Planctomycetota bacterium]